MSRRTSNRSGSTVDNEVSNLFKLQNKNQFANAIATLRQRYKDEDLVSKIQEVFVSRHSGIVKSAKKFAAAVKAKYAAQNVPFHFLLLKARAHAKKHGLSEAEFAEFQRIYEQELAGNNSNEVIIPETNLMKVLGTVSNGTDNHFSVNEDDFRNLQEILKLHDTSKSLHSQVILQALMYTGVGTSAAGLTLPPEMASAQYDPKFMNPVHYIHPVIAALFIPKLSIIESHFLYSNMAGIVKARYNRTPIVNKPDYELFYNLVTDPNDVVCDMRTPVGDLLHRCNLQNHLWNMVLHLRNGQIYTPATQDFITAIDVCRLNKHDSPELLYGRHDGTILKRLFSAFSFRPTTVATQGPQTNFSFNPYSMIVRPVVGNIPMINIRVPITNPDGVGAVTIKSSIKSQPQDYIEGNIITKRQTNVMYSREIMVFYLDRRMINVLQGRSTFNLLSLPQSVAGVERVCTTPITVDFTIGTTTDSADEFKLVSAVCYKTEEASKLEANDSSKFAIGSFTYLFENTNAIKYDPQARTQYPIHKTDNYDDLNTNATILIYKNPHSKGESPVVWM
jgi:hypothetical protein